MTHREGQGAGRRFAGCIALAALCAATPAWAAQTKPQAPNGAPATTVSSVSVTPTVKASDWIAKPTLDQVRALLPPDAEQSGLKGTAVLKCKILPTTAVSDCVVVYDSDPSHALGDLALRASALFKLSRRTVNGTLVDDQTVLIPLKFDVKVDDTTSRGRPLSIH